MEEIRDRYAVYQTQVKEVENDQYQIDRLEILRLEAKLQELLDKIKESQEDIGRQEQAKAELETKQQTVQGAFAVEPCKMAEDSSRACSMEIKRCDSESDALGY